MDINRITQLRAEIKDYTEKSTFQAIFYFVADFILYLSLLAGTLLAENIYLKVLFSVGAGLVISSIFVIGHDAAHNSYTKYRGLNSVIARISFLPALHNYSLWRVAHSRFHHAVTNLKGSNSWSPITKSEFDSLALWRQQVEKLYRSPLGVGVYYLCERWWKHKFFPTKRVPGKIEDRYWWDFGLLMIYLIVFIVGLGVVGNILPSTTAQSAIIYGFLGPFLVWNYAMGLTVYLQHTNKQIPWFDDLEKLEELNGQEEVTLHLVYPAWYGLISHNIMEHTAHHVQPRIPFYNLRSAQKKLSDILAGELVVEKFTPFYLFETMKACKVYDYKNHRWQNFHGRYTSECTLPDRMRKRDEQSDLGGYRQLKSA